MMKGRCVIRSASKGREGKDRGSEGKGRVRERKGIGRAEKGPYHHAGKTNREQMLS